MLSLQPVPLTDNARVVLANRYLLRDEQGRLTETPEELFGRVARAIARAEGRHGLSESGINELAGRFESLMASGLFLPNSPTLMNAGRRVAMLSACFVLPVNDSVEAIFDSVKLAAMIQKAGGGTGFAFDRLRPTGDRVGSSGGQTSGPISFWRVFSEATSAIQQGAFRRGANMGMMNITHPDILKFILSKRKLTAFENFNISIKVPDAFMKALASSPEAPHVVVNPRTRLAYSIPRSVNLDEYRLGELRPASQPCEDCYTRREMWELIVREAHATGEPGVCFIDRVNADNPTPHIGRIEATNPCGEQPLLDYEACNLGSINLGALVRDGQFDWQSFDETVGLCVRFLDDVIDANDYLAEPIRDICTGNRKIGLGIMGLADALIRLGISYDSDEAIEFGRRIAQALRESAERASGELAQSRGCFPNWLGSTWDQRGRPMRNAAITCVAPTGTISIIAGCSGGIEPLFSLAFERHVLGGEVLREVHGDFERLARQRGVFSQELMDHAARQGTIQNRSDVPADLKRLLPCARDIPPARHVQMQAAFQPFIDGAISKTINLPANATVADVAEVYRLAYELGCKGVTVYRDTSRSGQPMALVSQPRACPNCKQTSEMPEGCVRCPNCGATLCE